MLPCCVTAKITKQRFVLSAWYSGLIYYLVTEKRPYPGHPTSSQPNGKLNPFPLLEPNMLSALSQLVTIISLYIGGAFQITPRSFEDSVIASIRVKESQLSSRA